jgi:hypothetical protein
MPLDTGGHVFASAQLFARCQRDSQACCIQAQFWGGFLLQLVPIKPDLLRLDAILGWLFVVPWLQQPNFPTGERWAAHLRARHLPLGNLNS